MPKNFWQILSLFLFLTLLGIILVQSFPFVSSNKIADKVLNFFKQNLPPGSEISLSEIKQDSSGLYRLKFKVNGEDGEVYVDKKGENIFFQKLSLKEYPQQAQAPKEIPKSDKPEVKLFVMSYCPYGNQAEEAIRKAVELFGDKIDFKIHYIVEKSQDKYQSLHGEGELNEDLRELCVKKYQPEKFWDFVFAMNKETDSQNTDQKWEEIAKKNGIDVSKIKACFDKEKEDLLGKEFQEVEKYQAWASPTLILNGVEASPSKRTPEGFKQVICQAFKIPPEECKKTLEDNSSSPQGGCK
jgi:hypothetical protein